MRTKTSALIFSLLMGIGSPALASSFTSVSVAAGFSSNNVTSPGPSSLSVSGVGIGGLGTGGASAIADFGSLGVSANGTATPGPAFPTIVASADAMFNDLLFVSGPDGPVQLAFSLDLVGSCFATGGDTGGFLNASCGATAGSFAGPAQFGLSVDPSSPSSSGTFTWVGNSSFGIAGDLHTSGLAWNGSFDAQFIDTLRFYVWSTTPGVVITSESGHDYSPPAIAPSVVPEPVTLALVGPPLLALVRRRARR